MNIFSAPILSFLLVILPAHSASAQQPLPNAPPAWFVDDVLFQTAGSGRWQTDNSSYKSEQEPWDFYQMQWTAGPDNTSMAGEMSALKDGVKSKGEFWHFSQYWDPAQKQAVVLQNGWGVFGSGPLTPNGADNELEMTQTFTRFDGNSNLQGHRVKRVSETSYETWSYLIDEDGKKIDGRHYVWLRKD